MKEQNVFGLPMKVGTVQEISEVFSASDKPSFYVVMRCCDQPWNNYPAAIRHRIKRTLCERCNELCWYDTTTIIAAPTIICTRCLPKAVPTHDKLGMHASQESLDVVMRSLGRP